MTTYYAVCDVNGPISVRLDAGSLEAALEEFEAADTRAWIDEPRTDAEDDLDIDGADMDEDQFDAALKAASARPIKDLAEVVNGHTGRQYHIAGGWHLWRHDEPVELPVVDVREITLRFLTPPAKQGQIVEVSYAGTGDGRVIRRTHDQSDRTTHYSIAGLADSEMAEGAGPIGLNDEPSIDGDWTACAVRE